VTHQKQQEISPHQHSINRRGETKGCRAEEKGDLGITTTFQFIRPEAETKTTFTVAGICFLRESPTQGEKLMQKTSRQKVVPVGWLWGGWLKSVGHRGTRLFGRGAGETLT